MKKVIYIIIAMVMGVMMAGAPVMAASCTCEDGREGVPTAILGENGCSCDDGNGSGVKHILDLVVEIMTIGVGVLGVVGITIVGLQYLTAGGNEEQTRKAKRRMVEIVIGLAVYAVMFALLKWIIPNFSLSDSGSSGGGGGGGGGGSSYYETK